MDAPSKLIPVNLTNIIFTPAKYSMLGDILAQMCAPNQAVAYPPSLHISKATDILMVPNRCCPRLPLKDDGRKKGFKLYFNQEMASRQQKVELVNYPHN